MKRRIFCTMVGASALAGPLRAQAPFPNGPLKLIVPFSAGGGTDAIARTVFNATGEILGQSTIVDNKPGGSTKIATDAVMSAKPDGYTLLLTGLSGILVPHLTTTKIELTAMTAVAQTGVIPHALVVRPDLPVKTVAELIAYGKANPGKLNFASPSGLGGTSHLQFEMFQAAAGIQAVHVPYRGSPPAMLDLLAGRADVMFDLYGAVAPQVKEGKLRLLALPIGARSSLAPGVPIVGETIPGFDVTSWAGIFAPPGTPAHFVEVLNKAIVQAMAKPDVQAKLRDLGCDPVSGSAADLANRVKSESARYGALIQKFGLQHKF